MKEEEIKERLSAIQEQIDGLSDYASAELRRLNDLFLERVGKRDENDLDSVEYGTPSKGHIKIYFNAKTDDIVEVQRRVRTAVEILLTMRLEMVKMEATK